GDERFGGKEDRIRWQSDLDPVGLFCLVKRWIDLRRGHGNRASGFVRLLSNLQRVASSECPLKCQRICMFESAAGWEAMSDTGYCYAQRRERFGKVVRDRFAFDVRTQGEDDFRRRLCLHPGEQFVDAELFRTDVVQRSDAAAEDVVAAPEGARSLDGEDVGGLLDDTDLPADPVFIAADLAEFFR